MRDSVQVDEFDMQATLLWGKTVFRQAWCWKMLYGVDRDFRLTQELMKASRKETGRQERGTNRYAHQARMTAICLLGITIEGVNHVGS